MLTAEQHSIRIFDRNGRALVDSLTYPAPPVDYSDRDYFKTLVDRDVGTFIGQILRLRAPYGGAAFFGVSRRRLSLDVVSTGSSRPPFCRNISKGSMPRSAKRPQAISPSFATTD
jgi:hypothetical protein